MRQNDDIREDFGLDAKFLIKGSIPDNKIHSSFDRLSNSSDDDRSETSDGSYCEANFARVRNDSPGHSRVHSSNYPLNDLIGVSTHEDDDSDNNLITHDLSGSKNPFFVDVYHDPENCSVPASATASTIVNRTLREVMTAFLGDRTLAEAIDYEESIVLRWFFVAQPNTLHASAHFINDIRTRGATIIDPGNKKDGVDTQIKTLLEQHRAQHAHDPPSICRRRIVVLISGDRDYASSVIALRQAKANVMLIYVHSSEGFRSLVKPQYSLRCWNSIINGAGVNVSSPDIHIVSSRTGYSKSSAGCHTELVGGDEAGIGEGSETKERQISTQTWSQRYHVSETAIDGDKLSDNDNAELIDALRYILMKLVSTNGGSMAVIDCYKSRSLRTGMRSAGLNPYKLTSMCKELVIEDATIKLSEAPGFKSSTETFISKAMLKSSPSTGSTSENHVFLEKLNSYIRSDHQGKLSVTHPFWEALMRIDRLKALVIGKGAAFGLRCERQGDSRFIIADPPLDGESLRSIMSATRGRPVHVDPVRQEQAFDDYSARFAADRKKEPSKYCALHGLNRSHSTDKCRALHCKNRSSTENQSLQMMGPEESQWISPHSLYPRPNTSFFPSTSITSSSSSSSSASYTYSSSSLPPPPLPAPSPSRLLEPPPREPFARDSAGDAVNSIPAVSVQQGQGSEIFNESNPNAYFNTREGGSLGILSKLREYVLSRHLGMMSAIHMAEFCSDHPDWIPLLRDGRVKALIIGIGDSFGLRWEERGGYQFIIADQPSNKAAGNPVIFSELGEYREHDLLRAPGQNVNFRYDRSMRPQSELEAYSSRKRSLEVSGYERRVQSRLDKKNERRRLASHHR